MYFSIANILFYNRINLFIILWFISSQPNNPITYEIIQFSFQIKF